MISSKGIQPQEDNFSTPEHDILTEKLCFPVLHTRNKSNLAVKVAILAMEISPP